VNRTSYDYLVIGSGLAGLSFAIKAADTGRVALVTKRSLLDSNTAMAQGGVSAVWGSDDSLESHAADTISAGAGLCSEDIVRGVVAEGPARIAELLESGVRFSTVAGDSGELDLGLEGGHEHRRVLHAADQTGAELVRALVARVRGQASIDVFEGHHAVDLLVDEKFGLSKGTASCWGAYVLDADSGEVRTIVASRTVLASGGAGKVYLYTSNPDVASGDGLAMARRAGCRVANLEFMQFHPTCLYHPSAKSFLVTEALRGEGARLCTPAGNYFLEAYDHRAELAPRDIVARAIDHQMKKEGLEYVHLDLTGFADDFMSARFPRILDKCRSLGINVPSERVPVVPAAHYLCGGVVTDSVGATNLDRLYAIGEVAMTGLHGANRLASNSLLEALVFAHRAAEDARKKTSEDDVVPPVFPSWVTGDASDEGESVVIKHNWDEIRRLMWNYVGIERSDRRLERAAKRISMLRDEIQQYYWDFRITGDLLELRNLALVADLLVQCARVRRESRGLHYNVDCPDLDDSTWRRPTVI
jgi:L-aspartate oxidase